MPDIRYRVVRSARRTAAIQILPGRQVVVRCPKNMPDARVRVLVESKRDWILKKLAAQPTADPLTEQQLQAMIREGRQVFSQEVAYFAPLVGVSCGRITLRCQRTRWGSCSAKGNLNFNILLLLAPREVLRYVVVHELCHRKEMNHSPEFWALVESTMPDYARWRKWLKDNGAELLAKMP